MHIILALGSEGRGSRVQVHLCYNWVQGQPKLQDPIWNHTPQSKQNKTKQNHTEKSTVVSAVMIYNYYRRKTVSRKYYSPAIHSPLHSGTLGGREFSCWGERDVIFSVLGFFLRMPRYLVYPGGDRSRYSLLYHCHFKPTLISCLI